jgi:hypothetical protein
MKTTNETNESGDTIKIQLRGGTRLRMAAIRKRGAPYDKFLAAMNEIEVWSEDEQCWTDRWMLSARVERQPST